jgi:YfiH family protein
MAAMTHVLRSPRLAALGLRHGFNLRTGGHSAGPFESFNLARAVGDDPATVLQNHADFARAVGYADGALFEVSQVHGDRVRAVHASESPAAVRAEEGDALVATEPGVAIGVRVADCVPVLIADAKSGAVAAVHAGWRGVACGVVMAATRELLARGAGQPDALSFAIFPHIRPCCFEVGEEVAEQLAKVSDARDPIDRSRGKPYVDLAAIVRAQLAALGVGATQGDDVPGCTRCEPARFFSFRRDGQRSGRHVAAIVAA